MVKKKMYCFLDFPRRNISVEEGIKFKCDEFDWKRKTVCLIVEGN